jgi:hypothetical protein
MYLPTHRGAEKLKLLLATLDSGLWRPQKLNGVAGPTCNRRDH